MDAANDARAEEQSETGRIDPELGRPPACIGGPSAFKAWTTREIAIAHEHYPQADAQACAARLPHRSLNAIYQQALQLGLSAPRTPGPRQRWTSSEAIDAQIRRRASPGRMPPARSPHASSARAGG